MRQLSIPGKVGASFWWRDALPHTNQLGLGKRRWNLEDLFSGSWIFRLHTVWNELRKIFLKIYLFCPLTIFCLFFKPQLHLWSWQKNCFLPNTVPLSFNSVSFSFQSTFPIIHTITFYLESKAADYIAALSSQSNYAESHCDESWGCHFTYSLQLADSVLFNRVQNWFGIVGLFQIGSHLISHLCILNSFHWLPNVPCLAIYVLISIHHEKACEGMRWHERTW